MTLSLIMEAVGIPSGHFNHCENIPIVLYDEKDRLIVDEHLHFHEKLFENNPASYEAFYDFLSHLENSKSNEYPIRLQINEFILVVLYKTPHSRIFLRSTSYPRD